MIESLILSETKQEITCRFVLACSWVLLCIRLYRCCCYRDFSLTSCSYKDQYLLFVNHALCSSWINFIKLTFPWTRFEYLHMCFHFQINFSSYFNKIVMMFDWHEKKEGSFNFEHFNQQTTFALDHFFEWLYELESVKQKECHRYSQLSIFLWKITSNMKIFWILL